MSRDRTNPRNEWTAVVAALILTGLAALLIAVAMRGCQQRNTYPPPVEQYYPDSINDPALGAGYSKP